MSYPICPYQPIGMSESVPFMGAWGVCAPDEHMPNTDCPQASGASCLDPHRLPGSRLRESTDSSGRRIFEIVPKSLEEMVSDGMEKAKAVFRTSVAHVSPYEEESPSLTLKRPDKAVAARSSRETSRENLLTLRQVSQMVDDLKGRLGMDELIPIKESESQIDPFHASSGTWLPGDSPAITINLSEFSAMSEGEREFTVLHELTHIKHRDGNLPLPTTIGALFGSGYFVTTMIPQASLGLFLGGPFCAVRITQSILSQFQEIRADKEAFLVCSLKARKDALSMFNRELEEERSYGIATRVFGYVLQFLLQGITHPPLPIRIQLLERLSS